ncbi:MAG TPA: hypothetical protein VG759_27230 [Candidatus Angelobacter sp.]|nr:hypothetical protein [Candidatus Angelobacter sp.]
MIVRLAPNQRYSDNVFRFQAFKRLQSKASTLRRRKFYVADCTKPDYVEPAHHRLIQPAGWLAPILSTHQVEAAGAVVRLKALRACAQ